MFWTNPDPEGKNMKSAYGRWLVNVLCFAAMFWAARPAHAVVGGETWTLLPAIPQTELDKRPMVHPLRGQALALDYPAMVALLRSAPMEGAAKSLFLQIPDPAGQMQTFRVQESPTMEPGLAAQFPDIKSYIGYGVDDAYATMRLDISSFGFRAQILTIGDSWYIDPVVWGETLLYTSFYKRDLAKERPAFSCGTEQPAEEAPDFMTRSQLANRSGPTRRNFRMAVSATSEFTATAGGTVANALALINTAVNRMTGIYTIEFSVRFTLVANNNLIIYTNAGTDPFTNPSNGGTSLNNNQTSTDATIGSGNYDIGHVVHSGSNNGVAQLSSVCGGGKARGYTSYSNPTIDAFVVDYFAHEVGHQFGGLHPHSNCNGSPGDGTVSALVEPGSGSTIMGYAGICGATNLQVNSNDYFNSKNFDQVIAFLASIPSCGTSTATGNTAPAVPAPGNFTIPASTPFELRGSATDVNSDPLTFCWEQQNGGSVNAIPVTDTGSGPLFRSWSPTSSPNRTLPRLSNLIANTLPVGEGLPTTNRTLNWRLTVRDGRGGVNTADSTVTVANAAGPFLVTSPNAAGTFSGTINVTWNVAGTTANGVNCANVRILLSTDGGLTYPTTLAASVPNNGSASVTLPSINTTTARVRVEAVGNIFFDISNANFTIIPPAPVVTFVSGGATTITDTTGNGNGNSLPDPGETTVQLFIPVRNTGTGSATGVSGTLTSSTSTATIVTGAASYGTINSATTVSNVAAYVINVAASHPCGLPINLSLAVNSAQGGAVNLPITLSTGSVGTGSPITRSYTGPAVAIPDNDTTGASATLNVLGVGIISSIRFRFDGTSCSTAAGATTVGLNHDYVGDLIVRLTSPAGTTVVLMDRIGADAANPSGSTGHNFCQTVLDDAAATSIETVPATGAGEPYTGSFRPANPFSPFIGQNANGNWTLTVVDAAASDVGSIRSFSIIITPQTITCSPPVAPTGACCAASGSCTSVSFATCTSSGGIYLGDAVSCSPNPCPQPIGACCTASGSCTTVTIATCNSGGNTYQGDNTTCSPNNCPQPVGACCAANGSCTAVTSAACSSSGGVYQGNNTGCTPNNCPQPSGACCAASGACTFVTGPNCNVAGGSYQGDNTSCSPNNCPQPTGACCAANGTCSILTAAACSSASGNYLGNGTGCSPNTCPQPSFTVTASRTGPGSGTVFGTPVGINCGSTCAVSVEQGTTVVFTAAAAPASRFVEWSGACSGAGACVVTITGATTVTARFRCAADFNDDTLITVSDIFFFLQTWFSSSSAADFNGDSSITVADIFAFLAQWFAGC